MLSISLLEELLVESNLPYESTRNEKMETKKKNCIALARMPSMPPMVMIVE